MTTVKEAQARPEARTVSIFSLVAVVAAVVAIVAAAVAGVALSGSSDEVASVPTGLSPRAQQAQIDRLSGQAEFFARERAQQAQIDRLQGQADAFAEAARGAGSTLIEQQVRRESRQGFSISANAQVVADAGRSPMHGLKAEALVGGAVASGYDGLMVLEPFIAAPRIGEGYVPSGSYLSDGEQALMASLVNRGLLPAAALQRLSAAGYDGLVIIEGQTVTPRIGEGYVPSGGTPVESERALMESLVNRGILPAAVLDAPEQTESPAGQGVLP